MINDVALTIGLIWAMGALLTLFTRKDGVFTVDDVLFLAIVNVFATAIFFAAYGVSYLIAIGLN